MTTGEPLVIASGAVVISDLERVDESFTVFTVRLARDGLSAELGITSIDGDVGYRAEPSSTPEVAAHEPLRSGSFLRELAEVPTSWSGRRGWRSYDGELTVDAVCDPTGHVMLTVTLEGGPRAPGWAATVRLPLELGQLMGMSRRVSEWFDQ